MTVRIHVDADRANIASVLGDILRDTAMAVGHDAQVVVRVAGGWTPIAMMVANGAGMVGFVVAMVIPSFIDPVLAGVFIMKTGPPRTQNGDTHGHEISCKLFTQNP